MFKENVYDYVFVGLHFVLMILFAIKLLIYLYKTIRFFIKLITISIIILIISGLLYYGYKFYYLIDEIKNIKF